jgi:integrase
VLLDYVRFAESYYVKRGEPTSEVVCLRYSIRPLRQLYGDTSAKDFGPLQLKAVRQAYVDHGYCRNEVNKHVGRIVRIFKWAASEGMVPPSVHHGLQTVSGLRRGRANVRESEPVKPVPDAFVDAIRPFVPSQIWAMVELQRLSGMRPSEVCQMRTIDIDTSGRVWAYIPESHKTEHHGRERRIYLGPSAQAVLRPWLRTDTTAYLFQPREVEAERQAKRRRGRKTPRTPSERSRKRKANPKWSPRERYDTQSYSHAIAYAIRRANQVNERSGDPIPHWSPNRLRHNAATRLRKEFGLDVARAVLGHSSPAVTAIYAEVDGAKAAEAMERVG